MTKTPSDVQTADLTHFLSLYVREELRRLKALYPADAGLFDENESMRTLKPLQKARVELAIAVLTEILRRSAPHLARMHASLARSNKWDLFGACVAALGGGGALTVLLASPDQDTLAAIGAALALVGALVSIVAKYLRSDVYGRTNAIVERHQQLAKGSATASSLLLQLRPHLAANDDGGNAAKVDELIAQSNELTIELESAIASLPDG